MASKKAKKTKKRNVAKKTIKKTKKTVKNKSKVKKGNKISTIKKKVKIKKPAALKKKVVANKTISKPKKKATSTNANKVIPKKMEAELERVVLVDEHKFFHLKNGRKLRSILDLAKNLERMSDDVFSHHVTPYKNDFSAWIYHEFTEVELARRMANEKDKKRTIELIKEYYT
ncbi:MAG: hypothetical protein KKG59_07920 [Nanoarchaeota archaeon]|nr:hypothetical protein [Nanoarchaeota archaeon]